MVVLLLDETVAVKIYYDRRDSDFEDNICVSFTECCPPGEKIFRVGETNLYLTAEQARQLAEELLKAAEESLTAR